jgi:YggT family protein
VSDINNAGIFLVQTLVGFFLLILLLRLLLQWAQADFYNPIVQALVKITQPFIVILQPLLPTIAHINLAVLSLAIAVQLLIMVAVLLLYSYALPSLFQLLAWSLVGLLSQTMDIYFFAILVTIILSWLAPNSFHPGALLLRQLTQPVLAKARSMLPAFGGLDFSPILIFIAINLVDMLIIQKLVTILAMPAGIVPGL